MEWLSLLYPKRCVGCGREGEYICSKCQMGIRPPEGLCPGCCRPSVGGWTHPKCREKWGMEGLWVGLPYQGMVRMCLKKVKYKSQWDRINFLFELGKKRIYSQMSKIKYRDFVVTSVPMWKEKERLRGFNQADVLAKLVAREFNLEYQRLLERGRKTEPMYGLTRKARMKNVKKAFRIITKQIPLIKQKRVILVDDVWTTGATMREGAKTLKTSGVAEVWGMTLAR